MAYDGHYTQPTLGTYVAQFETNLASFIRTSTTTAAGANGDVTVDLDNVPLIGLEARPLEYPRHGLSTYFGRRDASLALMQQITEAEAAGDVLYEVRMRVSYTSSKLASDGITPRDLARAEMLNLPRASVELTAWIEDLIRDEIAEIGDSAISDLRLPRIVSRYPHLLDALIEQRELAHLALIVWEADVPGVTSAKIATLYNPSAVREVYTVNSDHVRAVLPARLYDAPASPAGIVVRSHGGPKL